MVKDPPPLPGVADLYSLLACAMSGRPFRADDADRVVACALREAQLLAPYFAVFSGAEQVEAAAQAHLHNGASLSVAPNLVGLPLSNLGAPTGMRIPLCWLVPAPWGEMAQVLVLEESGDGHLATLRPLDRAGYTRLMLGLGIPPAHLCTALLRNLTMGVGASERLDLAWDALQRICNLSAQLASILRARGG